MAGKRAGSDSEVLATLRRTVARNHSKQSFSNHSAVFPNLVTYHDLRDFGHSPGDKKFLLVTNHESLKVRDFGKFPKKLGKSSNFAQKVIISVTKNQK